MRLILAAAGRLKDGAERDLCARYVERFDAAGRAIGLGPVTLAELTESKAASAELRKADEAVRLLKSSATADVRVALDERGKTLTSEAFAKWIAGKRDAGTRTLGFLIGGPDGHGPEALKAAEMKLSLGPMTFPHGLARIVLVEQLYRAVTILSGHPYHRG